MPLEHPVGNPAVTLKQHRDCSSNLTRMRCRRQ